MAAKDRIRSNSLQMSSHQEILTAGETEYAVPSRRIGCVHPLIRPVSLDIYGVSFGSHAEYNGGYSGFGTC